MRTKFFILICYSKNTSPLSSWRAAYKKIVAGKGPATIPCIVEDGSIFNILFVSETEQKNTLAIQFLQSFLLRVKDKFGRAGDGYFEKKVNELAILEPAGVIPTSSGNCNF
jgi:hypothetical protein